MSRLTLAIPNYLRQELINPAQQERLSINQYIVFVLTIFISHNTGKTVNELTGHISKKKIDNFSRETTKITIFLPESLLIIIREISQEKMIELEQFIFNILEHHDSLFAQWLAIKSGKDLPKQEQDFSRLLKDLGEATPTQIKEVLAKRDFVKPEDGLSYETIEKLKQKIKAQKLPTPKA